MFAEHGLSVMQCPSFADGIVSVETVVMHSSGEWMASTVSAPVSKQDAQGVGSAITYCRRYSLAAVAGIAQEDDDANSAVGKAPAKQTTVAIKKQPLTPDRFTAALEKVKAGEYEWERLANDWALTEDQRQAASGRGGIMLIRCSSLAKIMTEPKDKAEGILSKGAQRRTSPGLAKEVVYGYREEISSKPMEKGTRCEQDSIDLYNSVLF